MFASVNYIRGGIQELHESILSLSFDISHRESCKKGTVEKLAIYASLAPTCTKRETHIRILKKVTRR